VQKTATHPAVSAFHLAAERVPAYRQILSEAGVAPAQVHTLEEFRRVVPPTDKHSTFGRFSVAELCRDGRIGSLAFVLTSSGHSGRFSFGLCERSAAADVVRQTDEALDMVFQVRSRKTLLINCLPMGVKVHTAACTLGETSVRADMVVALVRQFARYHDQVILVGEPAFTKSALELGASGKLDWSEILVHVIVGEELVVENTRRYLQHLLGIDPNRPETGLVASSLGVAELGLNVLFELPPLISLRRAMHEDAALCQSLLGHRPPFVPMVFTYDPTRIFVETDADGRMLLTTLEPDRPLPLIRYATGDVGTVLEDSAELAERAGALGLPVRLPEKMPLVFVYGRGEFALAGDVRVYPEQVREGIYHDPDLARLTTANFRLASGEQRARLRIQLAQGVCPQERLDNAFASAVGRYAPAPLEVRCETYETFGSGMSLDYERKLAYLEGDATARRASCPNRTEAT